MILLIPYVKLDVKKKSKVKNKLYTGTIYNNFFIKVKGDYYVPLYLLHCITNIPEKKSIDYTQYVFKWFKKYLKEGMYEHINNIVYAGEPVIPTNLKIIHETLLLNKFKDYKNHLKALKHSIYPERNLLSNYYRLIMTITNFNPRGLSPLVLRGEDATQLPEPFSKKDTFLFYINESKLHKLKNTPIGTSLIGKSLTILRATRVKEWIEFTVGLDSKDALVWVRPIEDKFHIPVLEVEEVDWKELFKNHYWAENYKISNTQLTTITDVYVVHNNSIYILTLWFKKKIGHVTPKTHRLFSGYSEKLKEYGDLFIIRVPKSKITTVFVGSSTPYNAIEYEKENYTVVHLVSFLLHTK